MITVHRLSKTHGSLRVVQDLGFAVDAGRVTGFPGPNGSGESTRWR